MVFIAHHEQVIPFKFMESTQRLGGRLCWNTYIIKTQAL